ncbi:hypothetical protein [Nocardioides sp.]|uniref:hypothetical protein n=1 Tax=Nocardioides sp. TaxID=35761 RepID=UPI001A34CE32|nr:hypothetical protein [Nocardioides sp.]MBJ7356418.1 hypothetical protein [Nocardioides sp.]
MHPTFRPLAALGAAALATATLALPSGTAAAAVWPAPGTLPGLTGYVQNTNVAIAPDGTVTAALLMYDDATDTNRVVTSSRPPRGAWSPPVTLSAPTVESTEPAIAIGPDGTTTIAWRLAPTEDDFVVQASTRAPGKGWSPVQSVSAQSTDEYVSGMTNPEVRLAAATDGSVTAVWPQWIATPGSEHFEVQTATRSAAGTWSAPDTLDTREWEHRTPELAAGPNGQVAVAWGIPGSGGADDGVFVRIRQGAGAWGPRQRLGNEYWGGRADLAYAPDGTLGVLWASGFNTPTVATLPPGGRWSTPRVISKVKVNRIELQLAAGPGPRFAATWTSDENGNYDQEHVYAATGGATGPWLSQPVAAATSGSPVVTVKSDGTAVVMWLWRAPTTYDYVIQASVQPPGGAWEPPSTVRDVPTDASAYQVALAGGPGGSLTAMWAEYDAADVATTYTSIQDPAAPKTGKVKGPKQIEQTKKGVFKFTGPAGATYQCRVDKTRKQQQGTRETDRKKPVPWKPCTSPYKVKAKKLKPGKHTVYVRAVQFGLVDPTPSKRKFEVQ